MYLSEELDPRGSIGGQNIIFGLSGLNQKQSSMNCENCKYRKPLGYTHHIECTFLDFTTGLQYAACISQGYVPELSINGSPVLQINSHGARNGWATWPINFDPIWITCKLPTMKIFFVGMFNKTNLLPLDSSTRTGKRVDKIKAAMPGYEFIKTNLSNRDYMPDGIEVVDDMREWRETYDPQPGDIVVLFGQWVHNNFVDIPGVKRVQLTHPAGVVGHVKKTEDYVNQAVEAIKAVL